MGHTPTPSRFGATFTAGRVWVWGGGQLEGAGGLQTPTYMVRNGRLIALITLRYIPGGGDSAGPRTPTTPPPP